MSRERCAYPKVLFQMYVVGWDGKHLSQATGIPYSSLQRKLRGDSQFTIEDAIAVKKALGAKDTLEALFERRENMKEV